MGSSLKKQSALGSTAAKTIASRTEGSMSRSYYKSPSRVNYKSPSRVNRNLDRTRELSPCNQSKMIVNFNDSIYDNKLSEDKRVNLALRYDFCLTELFSMVDYGKSGYLSLADWQQFAYDNSMALD